MPIVMPVASAPTDYATARPVELMVTASGVQVVQDENPGGKGPSLESLSAAVCGYRSAPNAADHEAFIRDAVRLMLEQAVFRGTDRRRPVLNWKSPEELQAAFDFTLDRSPTTHGHLLHLIEDTIQHSVKTGHPYFINQLFSSVDPYGLIGQWLTDALNPSVYTFEVAPVMTIMEETVLTEMRKFLGYPDGKGDGIFCPGGSIANGYAINCARFFAFPEVKTKGMHGLPRLVVYTSVDAHYSIKKLCAFEGIGSDNLYLINTDAKGKMDVGHLRQQIQRTLEEKAIPIMVSATAGTTVLGAFDPIAEIADVCHEYGIWLHVDAAWGGGALMSKKHKHLLTGIDRADSVTWNPHKMLTAPQQCSTFLTKHKNVLTESNSSCAQYLFQKDKFYDTTYDTGDKHIQCGRRADVFKFWFMWKAKGTDGLEAHVDENFDNAKYFTEMIRNRPGFKLVLEEPEYTNITFWYIPPSLRGRQNEPDFKNKLHKVAPKIKERMMKEGTMMITYQPVNDLPNFFRLVLQNSSLDQADMDYFVNEIERLGSDL
ncbi:cysteine sulfinic acid decarboxylase [Aphis gossypii]|uniref:cysteine sulfinic acid decarboxylase n=1 Tax=Aphis gossypii TaxID=80765 RepID=UPI0021591696|nr:cysteine sulfinic acid decarboxylase [Aphis gossypii]XP_027848866.2 cysteine sulfinic acid decarboxylase [Aphis gossypii]